MSDTLHVTPVDDLVEHDTATDQPDCVCGPSAQLIETDGGDGWLIVHNSLDDRETGER